MYVVHAGKYRAKREKKWITSWATPSPIILSSLTIAMRKRLSQGGGWERFQNEERRRRSFAPLLCHLASMTDEVVQPKMMIASTVAPFLSSPVMPGGQIWRALYLDQSRGWRRIMMKWVRDFLRCRRIMVRWVMDILAASLVWHALGT
ncbi:hypothetical protein AYX15_05226 [Cryptococcus neoformans]|nr:hypothetical protein AYX15_05226 [Cryptococcus neoformans var. grubii]